MKHSHTQQSEIVIPQEQLDYLIKKLALKILPDHSYKEHSFIVNGDDRVCGVRLIGTKNISINLEDINL